MKQAKQGDRVRVHFTGQIKDGDVIGSTAGIDPVEFEIGEGIAMKGLEKGVIGLNEGDIKTIEVPPQDGYGFRHEDLIVTVPKEAIPHNVEVSIGSKFKVNQPDKMSVEMIILDVDEETVTLDANHPLAGKTLVFEIELVSIL